MKDVCKIFRAPPPFLNPSSLRLHFSRPISTLRAQKQAILSADILHGWSLKGLTLQIEITAADLQAGGQGAGRSVAHT